MYNVKEGNKEQELSTTGSHLVSDPQHLLMLLVLAVHDV